MSTRAKRKTDSEDTRPTKLGAQLDEGTTAGPTASVLTPLITTELRERSEAANAMIAKMIALANESTTTSNEKQFFSNIVDRHDVVEKILEAMHDNLDLLMKNSTSTQQQWSAISLFNGSGAGKTHITFNLNTLIGRYFDAHPGKFGSLHGWLKKATVLRVYTKQCNGMQMPPSEDPKFFQLATLASQLLLPAASEGISCVTDKRTFITKIKQEGLEHAFNDPALVLQAIRRFHGFPDDQPLVIYFGHDEMQAFSSRDEIAAICEAKKETKDTMVYKYITSAMELTTTLAQSRLVFLVNTFTGTFPFDFVQLLKASSYKFAKINLTPLKPQDGLGLLRLEFPTKTFLKDSQPFQKLFEFCGNIPRVWTLVAKSVANWTDCTKESAMELLEVLDNATADEYKLTGIGNLLCGLDVALLAMIQRWKLDDIRTVGIRHPALSQIIYSLFFDGCLFTMKDDRFFIPIIFLYNVCKTRPNSIEHRVFVQYMKSSIDGSFGSSDFEKFVLQFFALKQQLFIRTKYHPVTVGEFFSGAYMDADLAKEEFALGTSEMKLEFFKGASLSKLSQVPTNAILQPIIDATKGCWAIHVGADDPYQDAIITLDGVVSIQFETKYSIDGESTQKALAGKSKDTFQHEQGRALTSPLRLPIALFVFVTNTKVTEKRRDAVVDKKSILVASDCFRSVFSSIFIFLQRPAGH